MSSIFLTADELQDLTGYIYPKYQRKWLINEGIPFKANRMGEPKVKRILFTQNEPMQQQEVEPDFGAI